MGTVLGTVSARVGLHAAPVARVAAPLVDVAHLGFVARRSGEDVGGQQGGDGQGDGGEAHFVVYLVNNLQLKDRDGDDIARAKQREKMRAGILYLHKTVNSTYTRILQYTAEFQVWCCGEAENRTSQVVRSKFIPC